MDKEQLTYLIKQFRDRQITKEELSVLKKYINDTDPSDHFLDQTLVDLFKERDKNIIPYNVSERIFSKIESRIRQNPEATKVNHKIKFWYAGVAAAVVLGVFTFLYNKSDIQDVVSPDSVNKVYEITPGGSKAVVLLEDGRVLDLAKLPIDSSIVMEDYTMKKEKEGMLTYTLTTISKGERLVKARHNTLVTPRGGEYAIKLPDGTQIHLNASSKIKYPLNLATSGREVKLEGEAFFDVKKVIVAGSKLPFKVYTNEQTLEVLGTSFNVNGYGTTIQTTLVEGAVKLAYKDEKTYYLKSHQQASYNKDKANLQIENVDPFYTVAWKTGVFAFDNEAITTVMETLSRWYDIDVEYMSDVQNVRFTGTISRYEEIAKVLELIQLTQSLKFKIEGRRVIVMS